MEFFVVEMASRQQLLRSIISDGEELLENGTEDERFVVEDLRTEIPV